MKQPIYEPKGPAREYGELALNVYTGCPHRCFYCFAPTVLRRDREIFHSVVEPRKGIVEKTRKQLERKHLTGKTVHLCFACDSYPTGYDSTPTREIIQLLKAHGNHVQILTKGDGRRDFDLLDEQDWYGVTFDGSERGTPIATMRISSILEAQEAGIRTWASFEPVLDAEAVLNMIDLCHGLFDRVAIGKLNYHRLSRIEWKAFGQEVEALCQQLGVSYVIKDSLRREMERR